MLRRLTAADVDRFLAYRSDPDVARYQSWDAMTHDEAVGFLIHCANVTPLFRPGHWVQIAVSDPKDDRLFGDMGLFLSDDGQEAELGITLARAAQGQGRATEAVQLACDLLFRETGIARILGIADTRNLPSLNLLVRAGFRATHEETCLEQGETLTERFHVLERPGQA